MQSNSQPDASKLKPCPFCGGVAVIAKRGATLYPPEQYAVGCHSGECRGSAHRKDGYVPIFELQGEIDAWNRRRKRK